MTSIRFHCLSLFSFFLIFLPSVAFSANIIGSYPLQDTITAIQASDSYLYAVSGNKLLVFDISNVTNPDLVDTQSTTSANQNRNRSIWVTDSSLFVGADCGPLFVYDLETPSAPVKISTSPDGACGETANGLFVANGFAYLADSEDLWGFSIYNVTDPAHPLFAGSASDDSMESWNGTAVQVAGSYAFVATSTSLKVYNISNPATPGQVGQVTVPGDPVDVAISGAHAFVTSDSKAVHVIDISSPADPKLVTSISMALTPRSVFVHNQKAYVAAGESQVEIIDVADPAHPQILESIAIPGARDVWAAGNFLYVGGTAGLSVVNISDSPLLLAAAGPDQDAWDGMPVTLDGSGSVSSLPITQYTWTQTAGPQVTITNANQAQAHFTLPRINQFEETLTFQLKVTNSAAEESTDSCVITVRKKSGMKILFTSDRDGDFELYTMAPDGTDVIQLTSNSDKDSMGRFSPDASRITFVRNDTQIWLMDSDGSNQQYLFEGESPAFSPDGTKLAYEKGGNISVYDFATQQITTLVSGNIYDGANANPDWSPDGQYIVFMTKFTYLIEPWYRPVQNIRRVKATDSTDILSLTDYHDLNVAYANQPRWSPDGTEIVITLRGENQNEFLATVKDDGQSPQGLAGSSTNRLLSPVWSPGGSEILCSVGQDSSKYRILAFNRDDVTRNRFITDDTDGSSYPLDWVLVPVTPEKGDVDGDGIVELSDAITTARILTGTGGTGVSPHLTADVNGNRRIDMAEMLYILRKVAGIGQELPNPPVADAGTDQKILIGSPVQLDGSKSQVSQGTPHFQWSVVSHPEGSAAALSDASSATPAFTPDRWGVYEFRLVVSDGTTASTPDSVFIRAGILENFDDNTADHWLPVTGNWSVSDGEYRVASTTHNMSSSNYDQELSDFELEVRMNKTTGTGTDSMALFFTADPTSLTEDGNWRNGYKIILGSGDWRLVEAKNGTFTTLVDWTKCQECGSQFGDWNTVKIIKSGEQIQIFVNGFQERIVTDDTFSTGKIGISMYDAGKNGDAIFDDLSIMPH